MRATIGIWAGYASTAAMVVMFVALTVESAAKGKAIEAAIFSPFAVIGLLLVAARWYFGK